MYRKHKTYIKIVAVLLSIVLIAPMLLYAFDPSTGGIYAREQAEELEIGQEDLRIAADVSNVTGATVDEILVLRRTGKGWNAILEQLSGGKHKGDRETRMHMLELAGLSEELRQQLEAVEFDDTDILTARAIIERLKLQLAELTTNTGVQPPSPDASLLGNDRHSALQSIARQFDDQQALFIVLSFRTLAGSLEAALDEYLFSLQAGIDLLAYADDWDGYLESKQQHLPTTQLLTLFDIEQMATDAIQQNDDSSTDNQSVIAPTINIQPEMQSNPEQRLPDTMNIKPVNPAQRVLEEINQIKPGQMREGQ